MKILALETSAKSVSCAVVEDGAPLASAYQCTGLTHSRTLLPMVDAMLKNADLTLDDINAIAIAAGILKTRAASKCPQCGQKIRIPRGCGKVEIHCPKCSASFIKKV